MVVEYAAVDAAEANPAAFTSNVWDNVRRNVVSITARRAIHNIFALF